MSNSSQSSDSQKSGIATTQVSFVCQRCCQPLKLDPSFSSLDSQTYADLTAPLLTASSGKGTPLIQSTESAEPFDVDKNDGVSRKEIHSTRHSSQDSGQDFTLLGEASSFRIENLSHQVKVASNLFDVMSGHSDIDHPLCEECTDSLLNQLDQQLKITEDECKHYRESLEQLGDGNAQEEDEGVLENEIEELKSQEVELIGKLQEIEEEREKIAEDTKKQKKELEKLEVEEERYWKEYNQYKQQLLEYQDEQRSVDNQLKYAQAQLDRLNKTNVFNATFHIWHNGHFGTIENFRLGRLPSVPVEWSEINAAWGQTVLLLHSLAQKMSFKFKRYRLIPCGNHSYLESLTDKSKQLPLHGSGGFRFFWDTKFDQAMVAFLDCLQQLEEEVERGDTTFCLPYKMANGKIEDKSNGASYSIRIQFNSEEQWTKALKFMLTNLKWALAWVSSQFSK
ncbi:beclin-1-like [Amphiura filiformis]|uniref:beclin-1-like n=1 Tax=Amphiura filiformis TaxID=82378 RepID=UPI003B20CDA5